MIKFKIWMNCPRYDFDFIYVVSFNFTKFFFKVVGVQRNQPAEEVIEEVDTVDRGGNKDFRNFFKFSSKK